MHRSGSGVFKNGVFEFKAARSISGEHSPKVHRPTHQLTEMMRSVEGDHALLKRLAARRLVSVLQGKVTRLYYRVMLRLTRERDELNLSGITKHELAMSRRSSNGGADSLSLNKTFSTFSLTQPIRNVRQFAALIGKKLFLAKLEPFQRLKRNMQCVRLSYQNIVKAGQQIKDLFRRHLKRLKRQAYFTLVGCSYSHVRSSKVDLEKQMSTATRKSGQHLIKVLKKVYRNKLREVTVRINQYSQRVGLLRKLDKLVCRIISRSVVAFKRQTMKAFRRNTRFANIFSRSVSFSNVLFGRLVKKSLSTGWVGLQSTIKERSLLLKHSERLGGLLKKLVNRRMGSCFNLLYLKRAEAELLEKAMQAAKVELEESERAKRKQQLGRYQEALDETERLLKKEEVENGQLMSQLITLERSLADSQRELRSHKLEIGRLERQLKEKDTTIKRLLIEQNRTSEFLTKQKEDIQQLRLGRPYSCECIEGKNREFAELTETGRHLTSLIEAHIEDAAVEEEQAELSQGLRFMRHQYQLFRGVLEQCDKLIGGFCLNPLFRNDYPVLSYLRGSYRQISEFLNDSYAHFLTDETIERYVARVRALPQDRQFDALELNRLTTQIIDQLRPDPQTSGYQLVRAKIVEFSRTSEAFNRQYRRLLDKNSGLKNLLSRLESSQKDMRNYLVEFHDLAIPTDKITTSKRHNEEPSEQAIKLIRPLLLDFMNDSTSYHKKRNIREKLTVLLELTSEERQMTNGHN